MERTEKRVLTLDRYEHGVVINALNEMRNDLLEEERPTDILDEVLLKVIDAPIRQLRNLRPPHEQRQYVCRSLQVCRRRFLQAAQNNPI